MVVARNVTNSVPESEIICDGEVIDKKGTETIFLLYRENCSKDYARALHKINAPCTIIMTLRKLKTVLPSRKPPVEKMRKNALVYHLMLLCSTSYVGETSRHLKSRVREHIQKADPM